MFTKITSTFSAEWADSKLKISHVILFVAAVCISLIGISIWGAFNSLAYHLHDKEIEMSNLSKALSSSIAATLTQADIVILGVQARANIEGTGAEELKKLEEILKAQQERLPQIYGFSIYDEQGRWLLSSNDRYRSSINNSDRDYFIYHRDHESSAPFLGPPIRSRATNEWVITLSRRINHADGSFAGMAIATVYLKYFLSLYENIDVGKNGIINLASSTGHIIVRKPFKEAEIGTDISTGEVFALLVPGVTAGTATIRSFIDNVVRVISFRRVEGYPLVVIAAFEKEEILADWRRESLSSFVISSVLLLTLGLLGYRLIKIMSRQIQAQKELQHSERAYIAANKALGQLALEDGLTGLSNRRKFDLFIDSEISKAKRKPDDLALILIDIDLFKKYNDHYGHVQGDECLKSVSTIIKRNITREGDLAARYGGEEFAIVLSNTDYVGAFIIAEKIRTEVERSAIQHCESPAKVVTISIGISALSGSTADTPEHLIDIADKALYVAKSNGRNRTVISNNLSSALA
ncbi:sensor domain-containing diguanylate cyclase [Pseudomonas sp. MWU13-2105]|uniref:sensor domain-containing diguanylate cyclase n=1 Tax=Pseudomonas sp. MWU13-2105 TaxID=2935074 RepID=UPI00200CACE3|nr:sensor domain-containing diguanylate cyclase [Pseudomonas sp. MWU13-2105]